MAKGNTKNNKRQQDFSIPVISVIDNIVLTKREAWAVYTVAEKPYLFLSTSAKAQLAQSTMSALGALCQSADKKVDCQLLITNQPFDPEAWEEDVIRRYFNYHKAHGTVTDHKAFQTFITQQADSLLKANYQKRVTYLAVKLGNRGAIDISNINPLEFGFKEAFTMLKNGVTTMFQFKETEITADEENKLRNLEKTTFTTLSAGSLMCRRPSSEEILLTIKRRLYPAMPTPYLETDYENRVGMSDIVMETGAVIEEKARYVKINQMCNGYELEGVRATVSFSKFPKNISFPSSIPPFLYNADVLPFTISCRFSLVPTEEMKRRLRKKQMSTEDEIENLSNSGIRVPESLRSTIKDQAVLEADLEEEGLPWLIGNYRITVEAPTEDEINQIIENIKLEYAQYDFVLSWTSGDQLDLLKEEFFGGPLTVKDFSQITNLALIGIAGVNYGGSTGDPVKQEVRFNNKRR